MKSVSDLYVGAAHRSGGMVGGIFRRAGDDNRWDRLADGLPPATNVHAITVHPTNRNIVYIGTQNGPYRSTDRGEH